MYQGLIEYKIYIRYIPKARLPFASRKDTRVSSIYEIGDAVGLKSSSTVKGYLDRLKVSGYVA